MAKYINSGTIFSFLVMSAPFLGISIHNFEHVRILRSFEENSNSMSALNRLCLRFVFQDSCRTVFRWCFNVYFLFGCHFLWIGLAISALPLWNTGNRTHSIHWRDSIQLQLAQLFARATQAHHFDHRAIAIKHQFQRVQNSQLQFGGFWKSEWNRTCVIDL